MKTRKLLALVLAIAVLASFISVPVFAEGEGTALETLGILIGTDEDGVTEEYLATTATRAQAALVNLRLIGQAVAALAFEGTETFTDAADATEYWQPILEYLKATPAAGWNGYEDGTFAPNAPVTGQAFTKVLLVALGYEEGTDFTWETVMDFAATVGLTALADKADADLTVEDLAMALVEALGTKINSATDVTLLSQLVIDGVIDAADAVAAGFEVEEEALVIVAAYASATDEVTVEMSIDPGDAVVTLKKGTASYNVTKTVDGSTITLSALFNLPAGTYTVTVGEETADFEVLSQYAVDLVIGAESLFVAAGQDLKVSLLDQYGDAMSLTGTNYSVFNQSTGYVYSPAVSTTLKIDVNEDIDPDPVDVTAAAKAGDVIYVFVYDPASMLTVSGELPVIAAPYLETLTVGGITSYGKIGDTVQTDLFAGTLNSVLDVVAYDQYGQAMKLTQSMFTTVVPYDYTAQVQILSSNDGAIAPGSIIIDDGVFTFDAVAAGTAVLTFIIPDQANIYTTEALTVLAVPALKTIEIAGPTAAVYATEAAKFAITGFDQYGNPIDVAAATGISFTYTQDIFSAEPAWSAKNEGAFTVATTTTAKASTVYYFLNGVFQGTFDVSSMETAYPFQIVGVTAPGGLEEGASDTILSADVEVIDQFGRSYKTRKVAPFTGGWDFQVVSKAALVKFTLVDNGLGSFTVGAIDNDLDTGAETFIAQLTKEGEVQDVSKLTFTYTLVESEDVDGFAITPITGTMYTGMYTSSFGQSASDYWKTVAMTGTYGEMAITLVLEPSGLPTLIDVLTSTNDVVDVIMDDTLAVMTPQAVAVADSSTTVKAWQNGVVVAETVVNLSAATPDIVTVTATATGDAAAGNYDSMFTFLDQYGVGKDEFNYSAIQNSRFGEVPNFYFFDEYWEDDDYDYYNIVKWDGSITTTYMQD